MEITVAMVKELRGATGAGVLEAKKALESSGGDYDKAVDLLREKGAARAAKRADREVNEGKIELYAHPGDRVGVILELNCETDFVARGNDFQSLAHELALQIAAASPQFISRDEVPTEELERETAVLQAQAIADGKTPEIAEKIVAGRMNKFYSEFCLLEQPYVKNEDIKVKDLITDTIRRTGENIIVRRFERYELGEQLD